MTSIFIIKSFQSKQRGQFINLTIPFFILWTQQTETICIMYIMFETLDPIARLCFELENLQHHHSKCMKNLMIDLAQFMFQQMKACCELDGNICSNVYCRRSRTKI